MNTPGKLSQAVLERLVLEPLRRLTSQPSCSDSARAVALGAAAGEDAAVVRVGATAPGADALVVVAADPITGAEDPRMAGALAVYVNSNDVLVQGGVPSWMTLTLLIPVGTTEHQLSELIRGVCEAAAEIGVVVVGGHTEVTESVQKTVVCGTLFGPLHPGLEGRQVPTGGMRTGDRILLTKAAALEGTAILLNDRGTEFCKRGIFSEEFLRLAISSHRLQEVSVHVEMRALLSSVAKHVSAMHDPTEGGIANALHEMCTAAGPRIGVRIKRDTIPVRQDTSQICDHFGVDPLSLISSGCVLATVDPQHADVAIRAVQAEGVACTDIGSVVALQDSSDEALTAVFKVCYEDGAEIRQPDNDSLWYILSQAML
ncbi:unnamed protein product [Prorocentrum cordatum]|uniref:Hydrogenase maturation factor n=1 Tax=Prorocentrum cordatum TaxID=2364126 RepID=A0ABN9XS49_9DINO|nr:unnamed protein product [Polarella glacialis]